jgi:hypothetical protein
MAIFGFGATYDQEDVSGRFIAAGAACVGWPDADAPPLHNILRHIKIGDIAFLKSFAPQVGLTIKAVGMVTGREPQEVENLGWGVAVRWVWRGEHRVGRLEDKYPVRGITLYEEYNPRVEEQVIDLLLSAANRPLQPTGSAGGRAPESLPR